MYIRTATGRRTDREIRELLDLDAVPAGDHKNQGKQPKKKISNPDQARLQYPQAYVWLRSAGESPGCTSSHPVADLRARMGCKAGRVGPHHRPVHIRAKTGGLLCLVGQQPLPARAGTGTDWARPGFSTCQPVPR